MSFVCFVWRTTATSRGNLYNFLDCEVLEIVDINYETQLVAARLQFARNYEGTIDRFVFRRKLSMPCFRNSIWTSIFSVIMVIFYVDYIMLLCNNLVCGYLCWYR